MAGTFTASQAYLVIAFLASLFLIRPPSARTEIISYITSSSHQLGSIDFPHPSHRYSFSTNFVSSARRRAASASSSCMTAYSSNASNRLISSILSSLCGSAICRHHFLRIFRGTFAAHRFLSLSIYSRTYTEVSDPFTFCPNSNGTPGAPN